MSDETNISIDGGKSPLPIDVDVKSDSNKTIARALTELRLYEAEKLKKTITELAAEHEQSKECIIFIKDLISELNTLMNSRKDPKNLIDVSALKTQLKVAQDWGAKIDAEKMKYEGSEVDRLLQNLQSAITKMDMKNQTRFSKMQELNQNYNFLLTLSKDFQRGDNQSKRTISSGIATK